MSGSSRPAKEVVDGATVIPHAPDHDVLESAQAQHLRNLGYDIDDLRRRRHTEPEANKLLVEAQIHASGVAANRAVLLTKKHNTES